MGRVSFQALKIFFSCCLCTSKQHLLPEEAPKESSDSSPPTWMGGWVAKYLKDLLRLCRCAKLG